MDERVKFIGRFLAGEKIASLCRVFGISRKTGHKIIDRYKDTGIEALTDRSQRPYVMPTNCRSRWGTAFWR